MLLFMVINSILIYHLIWVSQSIFIPFFSRFHNLMLFNVLSNLVFVIDKAKMKENSSTDVAGNLNPLSQVCRVVQLEIPWPLFLLYIDSIKIYILKRKDAEILWVIPFEN